MNVSVKLAACLVFAGAAVFAQGAKPSPPEQTSATVDGKTLQIKYSAPSLRGRKFIGGIHHYGQVWRAGANEATAFHTDADLDLGGLKVPRGDYTLYVLLDPAAWKLIVNKQTGQWGTEYDQSRDLGRVNMTMSKPTSPVEKFEISLASTGGKKGTLTMKWDNSIATVPFTVE